MEMHKVSMIHARIEPALKHNAEMIFHKIGLTAAEAVRLFYNHVCLYHGLPFELKIPNKTTLKAMKDAEEGKTFPMKSIDNFFETLDE